MNELSNLSVKSSIILKFRTEKVRDISYNSFLPEFNKLNSKRSKVAMEKQNNTIVFHIKSRDITAFKATVSDIIGFGKIITDSLKLIE